MSRLRKYINKLVAQRNALMAAAIQVINDPEKAAEWLVPVVQKIQRDGEDEV